MDKMVVGARTKLAAASNMWRKACGPAAGLIASCAKLEWTVSDAVTVVTDRGRTLLLQEDPPAEVRREVHEAVIRWRWRRIELKYPQLNQRGSGVGGDMRPIWRALAAKPNTRMGGG